MNNEFDVFHQRMQKHNITLPNEIIDAAYAPASWGDEYCFTPTGMLAAVAAAAYMLRRHPYRQLVPHPVPVPNWPYTPGRVLRDLLNDSVDPVVDVDDTVASFSMPRKVHAISACSQADIRFGAVMRQLENVELALPYAQIITHQGSPLFVRKGAPGHTSAISLAPCLLNGVRIPPGAIMRVETRHDLPIRPGYSGDSFDLPSHLDGTGVPPGLTCADVSDVTAVSFRRLSSFALHPHERTDGIVYNEPFAPASPALLDYVYTATVADLHATATRALVDATAPEAVSLL